MRFPEFEAIDVLKDDSVNATAAVIFFHGAGFTGKRTKSHIEELLEGPHLAGVSFPPHVKIYFPSAPERYVKIRDKVMTSWFDGERVGGNIEDIEVNYEDCDETADYVIDVINKIEATGIPRTRIALAGLSQGGMVAEYVAFTKMKEIAGVLIMASAFPFVKAKFLKPPLPQLTHLHGLKDPIIPIKGLRMNEMFLKSHGVSLTLRILRDSSHDLDEHYLNHFIRWILGTLPPVQ